jgi:hypothetical protein
MIRLSTEVVCLHSTTSSFWPSEMSVDLLGLCESTILPPRGLAACHTSGIACDMNIGQRLVRKSLFLTTVSLYTITGPGAPYKHGRYTLGSFFARVPSVSIFVMSMSFNSA